MGILPVPKGKYGYNADYSYLAGAADVIFRIGDNITYSQGRPFMGLATKMLYAISNSIDTLRGTLDIRR